MPYMIGPHCSTCHYCFNTCPVDAIRFVGVEYAIDPSKCISCGECAEVCPSGIISDTDHTETPVAHEPRTIRADAVVLGAGGAGLVAAVRYKQLTGKQVVVLEKAKKAGGNTTLGHAFVVRYSKLHEQAGMPDLRSQAVESIYNGSDGPDMNKELLRRAVYGLSDMFDWLCEFGGVEEKFRLVDLRDHPIDAGPFLFTPGFFDYPERTQNVKSNDHSMGPGWMGTYVIEKMLEQCAKLGIPVLTEHRAQKLLVDETGTFRGVQAKDPGGMVTVEADCCLVATGGFARNERVMRKLRPSFYEDMPVHSFSVASNSGDAIEMAEAIGAKMDFEHVKVPMFGPIHHPFNYGVVRLVQNPRITMVNMEGRRFLNEGAPHDDTANPIGPLESQPKRKAYAIFDSATAERMGREMLERAMPDPGLYRGLADWKEQLEYECTLDIAAKKADTLEELAKLIGIGTKALADEIDKYNMFCRNGKDEDFDKAKEYLDPVEQGPFYAVLLLRFNEGAEGGIDTDERLRVLRADGTPFAGLYVAGDSSRGVFKTDDVGGKFGEMPWAMASGYLAGGELADYSGNGS